ncbi:hypothetical protein [Streptomyces sp. URMC 123]|uniref:hypothetical protein n=1 Tax=Streptomyces sp. URMC 123 TaxID=3423403 RepID=UPI003F1D13F2
MLDQHAPLLVSPAEARALEAAMVEPEAGVSGAPVYAPEATGGILLSILISPREPREPKEPKGT